MKQMVSRDKMSRKAKRALDLKKRSVWGMNPATRIRESEKLYSRNRTKMIRIDE